MHQLTLFICFQTNSIREQMLLTSAGLSCPYAYVVPVKLITIFKEKDTSLQRKVRIKTEGICKHCICGLTLSAMILKGKKNGLTVRLMRKCVCYRQHNQRVKEVTADSSQLHYKVKSAWQKNTAL